MDRVMYAMDYPYQYAVEEVRAQERMEISLAHKRRFLPNQRGTRVPPLAVACVRRVPACPGACSLQTIDSTKYARNPAEMSMIEEPTKQGAFVENTSEIRDRRVSVAPMMDWTSPRKVCWGYKHLWSERIACRLYVASRISPANREHT